MKVFVIAANDFPETVLPTEEKAKQFIDNQKTADDERRRQGQSKIHWRSYEYDMEPDTIVDRPLSSLRSVEIVFFHGSGNTVIVPAEQVDHLVEATVKLHHDPGINPITNRATSKLLRIKVSEFGSAGPYWWTTPDLEIDNHPSGATLLQPNPSSTLIIWESPDAHLKSNN